MAKIILNETPVRTAKHFHINEIELDVNEPSINEIQNLKISSEEIEKLQIDQSSKMSFMESRLGLISQKNCELKVTVPKGVRIEKPINISFVFDKEHTTLVDNIVICYEECSQANFIISYECNDNEVDVFHYLKQETVAKANAKGKITISNLLGKDARNYTAIESKVKENANVDYCIVEFGGKEKISNLYSDLSGFEAENNIKTVYLGKDNDILDINYLINMNGKRSKCNIIMQGALDNNANKAFKGTIDFREGCVGAKGIENENCTLLSENAKSRSLPMLLCHEENVEGEHGVASGKIDENKLFYIMTKAIPYEEAKKLIVKANFNEIIEEIDDDTLKEKILANIDEL